VADELKKSGFDVRLQDGEHGEFKVDVDGRTVAEKTGSLPTVEQIIESLRRAA